MIVKSVLLENEKSDVLLFHYSAMILFAHQFGGILSVRSVPVCRDNDDESYGIRRRADVPP